MTQQWRGAGVPEDRVYFHVHGLPVVHKLKISLDSQLKHLFEHIPAKRYQPAQCLDGPEYYWDDVLLDAELTPEDYHMKTGDQNIHVVHVHFPVGSAAVDSARRAPDDASPAPRLAPSSSAADSPGSTEGAVLTHRAKTGAPAARQAALLTSPLPPPQQQPVPPAGGEANKIIDDLTQALRQAEDEIDDLQHQLAAARTDPKEQPLLLRLEESRKYAARLEAEITPLRVSLEDTQRELESQRQANDVLRSKIALMEDSARRQTEEATPTDTSNNDRSVSQTAAVDALVTSLRTHVNSLEQEVQHREEELRGLRRNIDELKAANEQKRQTIEDAQNNCLQLQKNLEAQRAAILSRSEGDSAEVQLLKRRIRELEDDSAGLRVDNQQLAQRVVAAESIKSELRATKSQLDVESSRSTVEKLALEKELKIARDKLLDQHSQYLRNEKTLSERLSILQDHINKLEDPRSALEREEESKLREQELRSKFRDALAENDRLKNQVKAANQAVAQLEASLFDCNNVLVRVQKENTEMKRQAAAGTSTPRGVSSESRRQFRDPSVLATGGFSSPTAVPPATSSANPRELASFLNADPYSLLKYADRSGSQPQQATGTPRVGVDGHGFEQAAGPRITAVESSRGPSSFQDVGELSGGRGN
jgi:chromosome segregation ATPase